MTGVMIFVRDLLNINVNGHYIIDTNKHMLLLDSRDSSGESTISRYIHSTSIFDDIERILSYPHVVVTD